MDVLSQPAKHSAAAQYLGFSLQSVRLCVHLLTCPKGAKVSLEYLDDLAIHEADGSITLEQSKSALKQNPLSDWANDLWKTIANWLDACDQGQASPTTSSFRIFVTPLRSGKFAQALNDANHSADVEAVVQQIQRELDKLKKPPACSIFLKRFLEAADDDRNAVVTRMEVVSTDDDPLEPIRALLRTTVDPAILDRLCQSAIGMAKERADRLIREGKPALLDGDQFKAEIRAFVQQNNLPGYLTSLADIPKSEQVNATLSSRPVFVRQLELIEIADDEKFRAVSDLLRSSADKALWAEQGVIFAEAFEEWDGDLLRHYDFVRGQVNDLHAEKPASLKGRLAYRDCAEWDAPLGGRTVPRHFIHGSFNQLADLRRLGWHPDYLTMLDQED